MCAYPLRCIPRLAVSEVHAVMLFSILGGVFLSVLTGTAPAEFASEGCWLVSRQRGDGAVALARKSRRGAWRQQRQLFPVPAPSVPKTLL